MAYNEGRHALPSVQVMRKFKLPAGVSADEVDAAGDGEVLVVLELAVAEDLREQGLARELVNRRVWVV
jgi:isoleucyl-tRNA synthetase